MPQRRYRVSGKVQGVGFRWWTRSLAATLGVAGSVRNLEDGSVEVLASGPEEALERLRAELASGPPAAEVSSVEEEPTSDAPTPGFRIDH